MSDPRTGLIRRSVVAVLAVATLAAGAAAPAVAGVDAGIVSGVGKAPITPDGDVAGAPTDVVITLDTWLDPTVRGRTLLSGNTVKITLPDDFVNLGGPVLNPGPPPACPLLDYDFLLWDRKGDPAVGVEIRPINDRHALLVDGRRVVGQITITAPPGASGQQVISLGPSTPFVGPVLNLDTARLTAQFTAGDKPGRYTTTFTMNNGTSIQTFVDAS